MKKFLLVLLFFILVLSSSACALFGTHTVYIDDFSFGLTTNQEVIDNADWEKLKTTQTLQTGYKYWIVYRFTVRSDSKSNDARYISASLASSSLNISGGKYSTSSEGIILDEMNIPIDAGKSLDKFWNIPVNAEKNGKIEATLIIEITPILAGESVWTFSLGESVKSKVKEIVILNGNTNNFGQAPSVKTLTVELTRIESPVVDYSIGNIYVDWQHVKFAESYEVYVDGVLVDTVNASTKAVGSQIRFNITEYSKPFEVYVIAKSPNATFLDSYESEITEVK